MDDLEAFERKSGGFIMGGLGEDLGAFERELGGFRMGGLGEDC
jgi:hypothetical protein